MPDDNAGTRKVCVVDSGYDMGHEDLPFDLSNTLITGESFIGGYDWFTDGNSHGTHVAGIIAAIGGNDSGVKGVIRNGKVKLHISRIFHPYEFGTPWSRVLAGFESCVQNGSNVVNMSLGAHSYTQSFADAIADAYSAGIVTFASAGDSGAYGPGFYRYPASYPFVVSVGSITESYERSYFSTYNDEVDLCAPGSDILSTVTYNNYIYESGTSMASSYAAGVAALVWSRYPELSHEVLISILEKTATDLPLGAPNGNDNEYGHGLINAEAAYEAVLAFVVPTVSPAPSLSSVPSNLPSVSSAPSSTPSAFCPSGATKVTVEILTDLWPCETTWDIKRDADGVVVASNYASYDCYYPYELEKETVCLDETETCSESDYTFTIYDSYGDGICCGQGAGGYTVTVNGDIYAEGGEFSSSESSFLCPSSNSLAPSNIPTTTNPSPHPSNGPTVSSAPSSIPTVQVLQRRSKLQLITFQMKLLGRLRMSMMSLFRQGIPFHRRIHSMKIWCAWLRQKDVQGPITPLPSTMTMVMAFVVAGEEMDITKLVL